MQETVIKIENLKKRYRLGTIGGGTLSRDIQSWWARKRGKEDPNLEIGKGTAGSNANDTFWALKGINLEVKKGECVGIIGGNGAGKSTLLKVLSRVTAPTEGEVKIKGRIASMLEVGTGFHGELTGRENIYMNGAILGMSKKEVDEKIEEIIEFSECRQFIDTPVKRYSSGMYVKLAFAVAAHLDAEILVMDEVLAVGDMKFQSKCLGKMGDVAENEGRTVLYVSHNMNTIRQLCDRCVVLKEGQVIFDGDVEEAIRIYLDMDNRSLDVKYDFSKEKRPYPQHGKEIFMTDFEFVGKERAEFFANEMVRIGLKWRCEKDFEDIRIMLIVCTTDGRPVGMSQSEAFTIEKDRGATGKIFDFSIENIVEGNYYMMIGLISINEFGSHQSYDQVNLRIPFEVIKDKERQSIEWHHKGWGNIRLNTIFEENQDMKL